MWSHVEANFVQNYYRWTFEILMSTELFVHSHMRVIVFSMKSFRVECNCPFESRFMYLTLATSWHFYAIFALFFFSFFSMWLTIGILWVWRFFLELYITFLPQVRIVASRRLQLGLAFLIFRSLKNGRWRWGMCRLVAFCSSLLSGKLPQGLQLLDISP